MGMISSQSDALAKETIADSTIQGVLMEFSQYFFLFRANLPLS
jgi:hypothetical protein